MWQKYRKPREALTVFACRWGRKRLHLVPFLGRRESGFWITLVWLISKSYANMAEAGTECKVLKDMRSFLAPLTPDCVKVILSKAQMEEMVERKPTPAR